MADEILTATEAEAIAEVTPPLSLTDEPTVRHVQQLLKNAGWVDVGEIDGKLGDVTKDAILSFRTRRNLPLVPTIDADFLAALENTPSKTVPLRQAAASIEHVAERVEAVKTTQALQKVTWWSKFVAWAIGAPSAALSLLLLIIGQIDEAIEAVAPIRNAFGDVLPLSYILAGGALIALVFGIQEYRISKLTKKLETELVDGYRIGTVKNDALTTTVDILPAKQTGDADG